MIAEMTAEMKELSKSLQFEKAATLRDEIQMLERLDERGELETHAQPEVFYIDPKKGLAGLRKVLELSETPRDRRRRYIAHLGAARRSLASCSSSMACHLNQAIAAFGFATSMESMTFAVSMKCIAAVSQTVR